MSLIFEDAHVECRDCGEEFFGSFSILPSVYPKQLGNNFGFVPRTPGSLMDACCVHHDTTRNFQGRSEFNHANFLVYAFVDGAEQYLGELAGASSAADEGFIEIANGEVLSLYSQEMEALRLRAEGLREREGKRSI